MCSISLMVTAQEVKVWEDPYFKPNAPGFDDLAKAQKYYIEGDYRNYMLALDCSCQKGNLCAAYEIGFRLKEGVKNVIEKDTVKAFRYYNYAAANGYPPAQNAVALKYLREKTYTETAKELLEKSSEQGYLPSKVLLGSCYLMGLHGVTRDEKKGIKLLEECANAGDVSSQYNIGYCYMTGIGVSAPDYQKAIKWLSLAANNGDWKASFNMSYMFAKGNGTEQNFQKAHDLLKDARFQAEQSGELDKEIEADILDSHGEIYLMENKKNEANTIWKQMKDCYPEYINKYKYEVENVFVRTMYEQEQENTKSTLATNNSSKPSTPIINSDIDVNIPENAIIGNPTFAVIIANENYNDVEKVPYANHDGEAFKQYCEKTLGIPKSNIKFVADATLNNVRRELNWLNQVMDVYQGEANIIFYYAGHGIPNESNGSAYLLPVDGVGNDVSTGYSLDKLYADLGSKPAKSVIILLDACFSGARRDGGMLASARGVAIKAKQNTPKGNMLVLSAAQGDETAYPYKEKGHGMFTYYLLKKLQETKGNVTFGELADYVTSKVKKQSIVINGKMQTPTATASGSAADWRNWKLR